MSIATKVINTSIPGSQPQINNNSDQTTTLTTTTDSHTTAIAVGQQAFVVGSNYSNNHPTAGGSIDNLYKAMSANALISSITPGRTITFNNNTTSTNLDLYVTVGGTAPKPLTKIATITINGTYMWNIIDTVYNWNGNFTVMPVGVSPPQYNAGPTIAEFGLNQLWSGFVPDLRDTFDISTVPSGIGTSTNDGPRSTVVELSRKAGFSDQQSYNYNVGVQIIPTAGSLPVQTVTCISSDGNSPDSIGYPNDTAFPKQQTGGALGNYIVNFMDPVVSL